MKHEIELRIAAADIGATHVRSGVFAVVHGEGMQCVVCQKEPLCRDGPNGCAVTEQVIRMIRSVCDETDCTMPDAVGISTAGPLSRGKERIHKSPNMPYADIPLKGPLESAFSCPVHILNDASAGVYYEYRAGSGKGCQNLVYLTISTGIGCGVISNDRLLEGPDGNAGEAGHFCVDTVYDLPCGCGGTGHWEAYSSGSGMPGFFRAWCGRRGHNIPSGEAGAFTAETLCAAARLGDPDTSAFFRNLAVINGRGLSTIIAAYTPERIVVGGPVATENPDLIFDPAREYVDDYLPLPEIVLSGADGMAPLMGAAVFAGEGLQINSYDLNTAR